jgi:hypothetical protein
VLAGQRIERGTIRLQVATVISGRVQDEIGEPVADASVTAWRIEFPEPGVRMWRRLKDTSTKRPRRVPPPWPDARPLPRGGQPIRGAAGVVRADSRQRGLCGRVDGAIGGPAEFL